ncbi:methylenetetrahydrofolate reductase [Lutibaculum baratangense]|uniref:Methylenetetrahydrofolate reductase n=1 Tax=Lutibaculum baratangense AMV1 TaxID=631454 RepID=V4RUD8_9HYPH|nr:methylenetetrahydrofolate reductase [Lutibaculum baratangense]ESR26695.1 5,10-methylenetetrahydrofolate reductase [Lutibaculum baratangense AMV1]
MNASIEATPKQVLDTAELAALFPRGTRVYLTDVGTTPLPDFVSAASRLQELGYIPVPHVAARRLPSAAALANRMARLKGEAGVDEALVVGGGVDRPEGPFASSMDVLRTGILEAQGYRRIAVAGHPEGSPDISDEAIADALFWKQEWAADRGIEMRIVTQFGFDAQRYIRWAEDLRREGVTLPIHVGVSGPAKITTLVKYAAMCGVGASLDFLKKRASSLVTLATSYSPEGLVEPLEREAAANEQFLVKQFHVFPFGGLKKTSDWLHARGTWTSEAQPASAAF